MPSPNQSVEDRLRELVNEQTGTAMAELTPARRLDELAVDSLDAVELAIAVEEEFGVEIDDEEAEAMWQKPGATFGDMVEFIEGLVE
jgi:acyl carrier protein